MSLPGGIRIRIVLVLVGIVAGALGTAYMIVVPSLERRLVDARLDELEKLAGPLARTLSDDRLLWQERVEGFAVSTNTRVVAFDVLSQNRPALVSQADSQLRDSWDVARDRVALAALASGRVERGRALYGTVHYANVAVPVPLGNDAVVLFLAPLTDSLATVRLVRERLLLATAFALVLALVLGLTAAGMLSHRLLRLETAAERIAGGDFSAPIVDHGNDEIGELARTFDAMRVQLAQLDNARKEFVANASHELRTPLFSIGGFLELLADEELDEATRRGFIETMQGQVQRLAKLSTDLLDLSRVDAGQLSVVHEPVDLGSVVHVLAGEIDHLATSSGHALRVEVEDDVWCLGDDARILQLGRALATNAITHTPPGTTVTLRARRRGDRAQLVVEDDGPGIPPSQRDAVFSRFYRVEGGMASGSGLGLAIARELARLMRGNVTLESVGQPTVFVVDLPAEPVPEGAKAFSRENGTRRTERVGGS
ncbi:MAG: integral rane sensor signal transduction histidine kinase [Gaiellaceae bacterium]|nr:integral rane sensor signal transduction histidine kinase [Gaiellaceae bacterium]